MTNEDEKIVADYMNWHYAEHEGIYYYDWDGRRQRNLDLNDAALCVAEMQKRGDYFVFEMYAIGLFKSIGYRKVTAKFIPWLFNRENFFGAMAAWLKEGKK